MWMLMDPNTPPDKVSHNYANLLVLIALCRKLLACFKPLSNRCSNLNSRLLIIRLETWPVVTSTSGQYKYPCAL